MFLCRFQDWIPNVGRITHNNGTTLFVIKCLYEIQDAPVMASSASTMGQRGDIVPQEFEIFGCSILPVEFTALFEFVSYIRNIERLSIYCCTMEHFAFRELAKLLIKDNKISELSLQLVHMNDRNIKAIINVLSNEKCKLTNLHINKNKLTNESAKYLSDAMKNGNCKLTHIDISENDLKDLGVNYSACRRRGGVLNSPRFCFFFFFIIFFRCQKSVQRSWVIPLAQTA